MKFLIYIFNKAIATVIGTYFRRGVAPDQCQKVLDWVVTQNLPLGSTRELILPTHLANITQEATVDAIHTVDNRYCVMLKTFIDGAGNFKGTLYCDTPLSPKEIIKGRGGKIYIFLVGHYRFEEVYLYKRYDDNSRFEVYFDLH